MDREQITRLWDLLPHPVGSVVYYMARKRINGLERVAGDYAENLTQLLDAAQAWQDADYNFYVQPNPAVASGRMRASAQEVTHWSWFYLDLDPVGDTPNPHLAYTAYTDEVERSLGRVEPLWIDSGRGMQAWYRLPDVYLDRAVVVGEASQDMRFTARRTMGYWLRQWATRIGVVGGCALDTSVSDLPRVMRCPGTINTKTGRMAKLLTPGAMNDNGLVWRMVSGVPPTEFIQQAAVGTHEGWTWQDVHPLLTFTAAEALRYGATEPGRHKVLVAVARSCREQGLTPDATRAALMRVADKSDPKFDDYEWIERTIRDTYRGDA